MLAILLGVIQGFDAGQFFVMAWAFPPGYGVALIWLYPIWIGVVALLYPFCRWVAAVKARGLVVELSLSGQASSR